MRERSALQGRVRVPLARRSPESHNHPTSRTVFATHRDNLHVENTGVLCLPIRHSPVRRVGTPDLPNKQIEDSSMTRTVKAAAKKTRVFDTDKRIRLGIWGLGRGMSFYSTCKLLNIDVVAGCDYNPHMREGFLRANPGAFVTASEDEFLAQDFDAVLLATYCPDPARGAVKCLRAGKPNVHRCRACVPFTVPTAPAAEQARACRRTAPRGRPDRAPLRHGTTGPVGSAVFSAPQSPMPPRWRWP